jgi:small nuclear ribonucleoprotein (snRNP)-like protein
MCRNDKDCPTSGEMTDAKSGAAKTNTKRKACQRDFSNAMEIVRLLRNHMSKKRMKIGSSTYAKNHREYQILFGLICTRQLYLVSCHRLHLPTKIQIDNHGKSRSQPIRISLIIAPQPPPKSKGGKMLGLINWRLKVTINDGRALTGQMLAFDRHMNLVLADCEEFRRVRPKKKPGETETPAEQEMKRTLGLVILRGETVVSLSVEGPPPVVDEDKKNAVRRALLILQSGSYTCVAFSCLLGLDVECLLDVEWE